MTRQDYLNQQRLPEWLKDFKELSDDFFDPMQYIKPKEDTIVITENGEITCLKK